MKMQVCDCLVALGSREVASMATMKKNITVPEAVYLNNLHSNATGETVVTHITNVRWIERAPVKEKARLVQTYVLGPQDPDKTHLLDKLFPGLSPRFPETFEDAGFEVKDTDKPFPVHDQKAADALTTALDDEPEFYDAEGNRVNEDGSDYVEPEKTKAPLALNKAAEKLAARVGA